MTFLRTLSRLLLPAIATTALTIAHAETHTIVAKAYYRTFGHQNPVLLRIKPGDIVSTKTLDSGGQDDKDVHAGESGNPLTGPFYVEGTEPGDVILVRLRKVRLNRKWGYSGYRLGLFALTPEYVERLFSGSYKPDLVRKGSSNMVPWDLDIVRNTVHLREPESSRIKFDFPAKPMLGCIGVAAPGDFTPTSGPAGSYGGNLDYNGVVEGATVILPVYHRGALLYVGDGHALMGDGEPTGNGIETSMDVEFSVEIRKNSKLTGPRLENSEHLISLGAQPEFSSSLDRALQMATTDMAHWLIDDYKLEPWAAHTLIAFQGKYEVVTVAGTMALKIPKAALPSR
jgi:acetamidase/formamidase